MDMKNKPAATSTPNNSSDAPQKSKWRRFLDWLAKGARPGPGARQLLRLKAPPEIGRSGPSDNHPR